MKRKAIFPFVCVLAFSGMFGACAAGHNIVAFSEQRPAPTAPDSVVLFATQLPNRPYTELGMVRVPIGSDKSIYSTDKLKKKAASFGADAVVNLVLTDFRLSGVMVKWK